MENAKDTLIPCIKAGYSHFYVYTHEMGRSVEAIRKMVEDFKRPNGEQAFKYKTWSIADKGSENPLKAISTIDNAEPRTVFVLKNYNWTLDPRSPVGKYAMDITQSLQDRIEIYRAGPTRKIIVIVASVPASTGLPKELVDDFLSMKFDLPDEEEIVGIYDYVIESAKEASDKIVDQTPEEKAAIVDAAKGMFSNAIKDSFALSIVKEGHVKSKFVNRIKSVVLENVAGIKYGEYTETFENLIGYDALKSFVLSTIMSPLAKGIMLVGFPGTGKSHFAKCLGNETGRPVLEVEFANVYSSLLGETYSRMQALIDVIIAMKPCVVFIDELEKGLAGVGDSGGVSSNEVTKRAMSMWLKFMNDRPKGIYIIATCNDITAFNAAPEYLRAERWDTAPFFVNLPNKLEKDGISKYYKSYDWSENDQYKTFKVEGKIGKMEGWSGAEIKAACRNAAMTGETLDTAKDRIIPISRIVGQERMAKFLSWAEENTIPATTNIALKSVKKMAVDLDLG